MQSKSVGEPGPIRQNKKLETVWNWAGGTRMHVRASGNPAPTGRIAVVLVHGLVVSSRYMIPTAVRLAPHYQVFVPDLPGFGRSERPPGILDVAELSDALSA